MKSKLIYLIFSGFLLSSIPAHALDPVAPIAERQFGMVYVEAPKDTDKITLTGISPVVPAQTLTQKTDIKVNVGRYNVRVDMDAGQSYSQDVQVTPTERSEIITPGYGNLRINGTGTVTVYKAKTQEQVAQFPAGEVRTLPRGYYDIKINTGKHELPVNDVWVVTNTTREIDLK